MNDSLDMIRRAGVLAVIRAPHPSIALDAIEALRCGGVTGIEVTYSTPDAAEVIATSIERYGDTTLIGAGTVLTADQAREAAEAGAAFLVSPGTKPALVTAMRATGRVCMTGAMTPTEVMSAMDSGADVVKVFPASVGGPSYLSALRGPFPTVPLMPTGGVNPANLAAWFEAGAVAVGAGSDLVPPKALLERDMAEIERRAVRFASALASSPGRI